MVSKQHGKITGEKLSRLVMMPMQTLKIGVKVSGTRGGASISDTEPEKEKVKEPQGGVNATGGRSVWVT